MHSLYTVNETTQQYMKQVYLAQGRMTKQASWASVWSILGSVVFLHNCSSTLDG